MVITTETLAASNSRALIDPSQTAPPCCPMKTLGCKERFDSNGCGRRSCSDSWIPEQRCRVRLCSVQKRWEYKREAEQELGGPNSTFRRSQTAAPHRWKKVGGQSEYVHAAADQASPQKGPRCTRTHTCSHVQAAEHR